MDRVLYNNCEVCDRLKEGTGDTYWSRMVTAADKLVQKAENSLRFLKAAVERVKDMGASGDEYEPCVICLCPVDKKELGILPCGHTFHVECIKQTLSIMNEGCPTCREPTEVHQVGMPCGVDVDEDNEPDETRLKYGSKLW